MAADFGAEEGEGEGGWGDDAELVLDGKEYLFVKHGIFQDICDAI